MNPTPGECVATPPGYYTCQFADSGAVVRFSLDGLDGLQGEVMTGFGAIPRRGAEVGGILLGHAAGAEVWVDGFAIVPCEHRRGPSYLLSDLDRETFAKTFAEHAKAEQYPVGLFRSNTRDAYAVTDEDRALFTQFFPLPSGVFLLIRPFATKTSIAAFVVPKDGALPDSPPDTFPFSRWELEGGTPPKRRALNEPKPPSPEISDPPPASRATLEPPRITEVPAAAAAAVALEKARDDGKPLPLAQTQAPAEAQPIPGHATVQAIPASQSDTFQPTRRGWVWIPLSFIFLLLGMLLGFQAAISFYSSSTTADASAFALGLTATGKEGTLHIRWNREAPAIRAAERGRLEIKDGNYGKTVDLDASSLQTGSVIYPPLSSSVSLRFQVIVKGSTEVVETLDWSKPQAE